MQMSKNMKNYSPNMLKNIIISKKIIYIEQIFTKILDAVSENQMEAIKKCNHSYFQNI